MESVVITYTLPFQPEITGELLFWWEAARWSIWESYFTYMQSLFLLRQGWGTDTAWTVSPWGSLRNGPQTSSPVLCGRTSLPSLPQKTMPCLLTVVFTTAIPMDEQTCYRSPLEKQRKELYEGSWKKSHTKYEQVWQSLVSIPMPWLGTGKIPLQTWQCC